MEAHAADGPAKSGAQQKSLEQLKTAAWGFISQKIAALEVLKKQSTVKSEDFTKVLNDVTEDLLDPAGVQQKEVVKKSLKDASAAITKAVTDFCVKLNEPVDIDGPLIVLLFLSHHQRTKLNLFRLFLQR